MSFAQREARGKNATNRRQFGPEIMQLYEADAYKHLKT